MKMGGLRMNFCILSAILVIVLVQKSSAQVSASLKHYREIMRGADELSRQSDSGTLIVGGREAPMGKYTYTAGLREFIDEESFCGGSVIAKRYILTAAHCVDGADVKYVSIGTHYRSGTFDGQQLRVKGIIVHPEYDPETMSNDFAILEVKTRIKFPSVALAAEDDSDNEVGRVASVHGWGDTKENGKPSDVLRETDVMIVSNEECERNVTGITDVMLCAGVFPKHDSCQGDSGGPLVVRDVDESTGEETPILVGVVSWGLGCAKKYLPGIYARVSRARDFIDKHVDGHSWRRV